MKNDKEDLIEFAKKTVGNYSKLRIWLEFSFFGGLVGGFLIGIMFAYSRNAIFTKLLNLLLCSFIGIIVGFIPASLTGWVLVKKKFIILEKLDYLKVFFIGGFFGTIYGLILAILFKGSDFDLDIMAFYGASFMALSGISAMICGKLFLPKAKI